MTKYYIQGGGQVELTRSDFKAQGGEGSIYVQGSTAYKVYTDPARMIAPAKVGELATLAHALLLQLVPQAPQLVTVLDVLVSQPLAFIASQLAKPALHVAMPQVLDAQL